MNVVDKDDIEYKDKLLEILKKHKVKEYSDGHQLRIIFDSQAFYEPRKKEERVEYGEPI